MVYFNIILLPLPSPRRTDEGHRGNRGCRITVWRRNRGSRTQSWNNLFPTRIHRLARHYSEVHPRVGCAGVQLGLALVLLRTAAGYLIPDPLPFVVGAGIIGVGFFLASRYRITDLSSIVVIITAFAAGIHLQGLPHLAPPQLHSPVIPKHRAHSPHSRCW